MKIGVPRESKFEEYRVGLAPSSVRALVSHGHEVAVERGAGEGSCYEDAEYAQAGANVVGKAAEVFAQAEMIVKVEEPALRECRMLRPRQVLLANLHLAADRSLAEDLLRSGAVCIAYDTVTQPGGGLPLLAPMSEIAGHLAIQEAGHYLMKSYGRRMLLGGVPGVAPARVVILGAGVVGSNAAQVAVGTGADVIVIDRSPKALQRIEQRFGARVLTLDSTAEIIEQQVLAADVVIGAAHEPGAAAPVLVPVGLVSRMKKGAVVVDVAIDNGGCFETSRRTTPADPTFLVQFVVHYCVPNMAGAVPRTATQALNNVSLPFVLEIANRGWQAVLHSDPHLMDGLNVALGKVTHRGIARALGYEFFDPAALV